MDILRIGRISSVNYEKGTARIVYNDRNKAVTQELPIVANAYEMPNVDDMVLVAHLPNGSSAAFILGKFWNEKNTPPESGKKLYRKDLDKQVGKCFVRYDGENSGFKLHNDGVIEITGNISIDISGGSVNINAAGGDVNVSGISLVNHVHAGDNTPPTKG